MESRLCHFALALVTRLHFLAGYLGGGEGGGGDNVPVSVLVLRATCQGMPVRAQNVAEWIGVLPLSHAV